MVFLAVKTAVVAFAAIAMAAYDDIVIIIAGDEYNAVVVATDSFNAIDCREAVRQTFKLILNSLLYNYPTRNFNNNCL
jgi:hypothetical protein